MNKKIKQLAEQADWRFSDKITGDELQPILDKRLEKFAELIVRECADMFNETDAVTGSFVKKVLKEHFGVEE